MTDRKWRADEETGRSYTRTQNWDTSTYPHEKINRCLTGINRCLTDIFKI